MREGGEEKMNLLFYKLILWLNPPQWDGQSRYKKNGLRRKLQRWLIFKKRKSIFLKHDR